MADSTANIMNFFKMSLFLAALPAELCTIVNLHDQNDMTIIRCTRSQQYYKEKTKIPKELQLWTLPMTRTRTKKKLLCFGNATPDGMVPNKDER